MANGRSICFVGIENLLVLAPEHRTYGIGGAQLQQTLLARALARSGFRVSMVVADLGQPDGATWDGIKTFKAYRMNAGVRGLRLIHPRATGVWNAMKRAAADIYYCSCADYVPGILAVFAKFHPCKTVFRIAHDTDCQPSRLLIPNWRSKAMYRYGLKRMDLILAQSASQQRDMLNYFRLPSRVVPSLVEMADRSLPLAARDIPILWVGNMRPFKRPELALDLASALPDHTLHMVGGEDPRAPECFAEIQRRAHGAANVVFHGPLPFDEVERRMARTRLFINTSESEGFPNTYMQAWARGTPVVALFDPDRVIEREGLGRAVRDLGEMRTAIIEFLDRPALWEETSARCIDYVARRHGQSAVQAYVDALGQL